MLTARRVWTVLVGVWAGGLLARIVLEWVLDVDGTWVAVGVIAAALVGGALRIGEARRLEPMSADERRDALLGWGAVIGGVAAVACLFLPFPWGVLAAAVVVALTVLALRHA